LETFLQKKKKIKLGNVGCNRHDMTMPNEYFLLQVGSILEFLDFEHINL